MPKALDMLGKNCIAELYPQTSYCYCIVNIQCANKELLMIPCVRKVLSMK